MHSRTRQPRSSCASASATVTGRPALHYNIADLLHAAGREDEAVAHLTRAVTLFAEVGTEAGREPEIRKLVDW